ncbi:MAG: shikimate kinase [Acidimicrobiia bacterium]
MAHVWLIGMMGTGKSTVGALVAEQLQIPLVDVDALIVEHNRRTISEIFTEGEATFRALESATIAAVATRDDAVIATGGGAVLDPSNVDTMRESGVTVLLTATLEQIECRLRGAASRPLLTDAEALSRIYETREHLYAESADIVIDTTDLDAASAAEEVLKCVAT